MKNRLIKFFKAQPGYEHGLSQFRLSVMRALFLLTFVFLGYDAWTALATRQGPWDPLHGVAFSFWAAYAALMGLGIFFPLTMLPLLLLQFLYKTVWLVALAYPLWSAGQLQGNSLEPMASMFTEAVVLDILVIPWSYVVLRYFRNPRKILQHT